MNTMRLYFDRELTQPIATIRLPMRTPPTILNQSVFESITNTRIFVFDENQEIQIASTVHGCYFASQSGINPETESVLKDVTDNQFPWGSFPAIQAETESEWREIENNNPRYCYTEGGTCFQVFHGETATHVFFGLSAAYMYTAGPTEIPSTIEHLRDEHANAEGYQLVPPGKQNSYGSPIAMYAGNSYDISSMGSFNKADYQTGSFKLQFVRNAYRFADEEDAREIILAVPTAVRVGQSTPSILGNSRVKAYTTEVLEGVSGYIPDYQPTDNNVTRGGTGNGAYPHSPAEGYDNFSGMIADWNRVMSVSMGNGLGLTYYQMSKDTFAKCLSFAYAHDGIVEGFKAEARRAAFVAAYLLPCRLQIANHSAFHLADDSRAYLTAVGDGYLDEKYDNIPFGEINLAPYGWDDFADYTDTTATLYLPFVGNVSIDMNYIARGSIRLESVIDITNGNIAYWVYTLARVPTDPVLYGVYTGNCAVQIPVTGVYAGNVLDKIVNAGSSIVNRNPVGMIQSAIGLKEDIRVGRDCIVDPASASIVARQPRLVIERRDMLRAANSKDITGIPSYVTAKLNTLHGFVKVADVDVSGLTCEENEANEIRNLLKEGVYL